MSWIIEFTVYMRMALVSSPSGITGVCRHAEADTRGSAHTRKALYQWSHILALNVLAKKKKKKWLMAKYQTNNQTKSITVPKDKKNNHDFIYLKRWTLIQGWCSLP